MIKYLRQSITCAFFFWTILLLGQTGPGGVGKTDGTSKLDLWLNASVGVQNASSTAVGDGADVTFWRDQSGNGFDAQQLVAVDKPNYDAAGLGGEPTINFTEADTEFISVNYTFQEDVHAFVVGASTPTNWSDFGLLGSSRGSNGLIFHTDNGAKSVKFYNLSSTGVFFLLGQVIPSDITVPNIYGLSLDHTTGTVAYDYGYNGSSATGSVSETRTSTTEPVLFGRDDCCGTRFMDGKIGEIIYFNEKLNTAENIIVNNYLSAKYGITLSSNDFYDEDTTGENFDYNVAGIGQASDGTNHTDSQGTGIIKMNTPSGLGNDEFLFWGEDVKSTNYNFSTTTEYTERINGRKWRVSERGDVGTVSVSVAASALDLTGFSCGNLNLVVSNTSTFTTKTSYPFTLSSGVYTATGVDFSDNDYFSIEYADQIVLDGATAYNGSGGTNKPNTSDDCYKLLVKANTLTLSEDADVREIEIEASSILAVNSGIRLQVTNGINNLGDIHLVGGSQLVQTHTGTNLNTGAGNLYVDQTASTSSAFQSGYWSSPVSTAVGASYAINDVLKDGSTATTATTTSATSINFSSDFDGDSGVSPIKISTRWLATFNNALDWTRFVNPIAAVLTPGLGWNMKSVGATFTFKGIPNDGNYTFSLDEDNYSLLGNPYPSALDSEAFITDNAGQFNGILYIYNSATDNTHVRGDYTGTYSTIISGVTVGGGRYLPIGQAFFVTKETPGTGTITFQNSQRTLTTLGDTGAIFAKELKGKESKNNDSLSVLKIGFEFQLSEIEKRRRQVAVSFRGLTRDYEKGFDAEMWGKQPTDMYLKVNDKDVPFIITGIESFNTSLEIPLAVELDAQRNVTFSIDEKQNIESPVYLFDSLTNSFYDIGIYPQVLNLSQGLYSDRFFITFSNEILATEDIDNSSIKIFKPNATALVIKNTSSLFIEKVVLYNMLGKKVGKYSVNSNKSDVNIDVSKLAKSIYIVSLETNKGRINKKIVL